MESFHAKRAAVIYNPSARGLSRRQYLLERSIAALARQDIEAQLVPTTAPGSASAQAREQIENGCDLILAAGGDGTINEVANGMLHSRVPLAILPGGTANVLAREIRLPMHMERAASSIRQLKPHRMAVGGLRFDGPKQRGFVCMAGAGLDAEIISRLNLDLKAAAGKLAYYLCGFAQVLRTLPEFEVIVDGKRHTASFALISRVKSYGGDLQIARGASLFRNDFEVVLFRGTKAMRYLPYLVGVTLGQAARMNGCSVLYGRTVICQRPSGEPVYVQVDGELAGALPMTAEIIPDALTLLVPPQYHAREQSLMAVPACA
ncbi:MAG: diacylglycerol/lipid kinase family protein [Bryobacteraceae bacterium]